MRLWVAFAALALYIPAHAQTLTTAPRGALQPIWADQSIEHEPLMFTKDAHGRASARLLYTPKAAPQLSSNDGRVKYVRGADFKWSPGSDELVLTKRSRIPAFSHADLHPAQAGDHAINAGATPQAGYLMFGGGDYFYQRQACADYSTARKWGGPVPPSKSALLPQTQATLKAGRPINLVVLGDSISAGYSASMTMGVEPNRPPYANLVADGLKDLGAGGVSLKNLSVGGKTSEWGVTQLAAVLAEKPDLVIIAFGMNDASYSDMAPYLRNISGLVSGIKSAEPGCEIILVSPMRSNREWWLHQSAFDHYPTLLRGLERPGVAVADVTAEWDWVEGRKGFWSMTGNGVNHPNDLGHQIYADTILATIAP
jgi:acyl-CoA thioesterase-1